MVEQIIFRHSYANIVRARHQVGRGAHFVHLENRGFIVIALRCLPWESAQKVRVVERRVVVAPVGHMLYRARAR